MRLEFAQAILDLHQPHHAHVFLTGDLGFMALEKVQEVYGARFINAGVAEQNMMSVAAGLAYSGLIPWVYSITPFAVFRPYEQIRNDICLHSLPVKIVGNGGGYGYGIMGATHHALEDIAVMRVLPHMKVYIPLVAADVEIAVRTMALDPSPNYLRLNTGAKLPSPIDSFRQWRKIKEGNEFLIIGAGPVLGNIFELEDERVQTGAEVWAVGQLPIAEIPHELLESLKLKKKVLIIEEHQGACGLNEALAALLLKQINFPITFESICAEGYPSGKYGSQRWHQEESGLAGEPLLKRIREFMRG